MIELAKIDEVKPSTTKRVDVAGYRLCLINIEGSIYAIDDRCTHADYSLSEGILDESEYEIECPKHGAIFDINSGDAKSLPATKPVNTYEVVVEGGVIFLKVDENV